MSRFLSPLIFFIAAQEFNLQHTKKRLQDFSSFPSSKNQACRSVQNGNPFNLFAQTIFFDGVDASILFQFFVNKS